MPAITFWFELASTYSYLSAMRIDREAAARKVDVEWRPFLLGPIFREQGWKSSPFLEQPAKLDYMWRDIGRRCAALDAPFEKPSPALRTMFPCRTVQAARLALVGLQAGWGKQFIRTCYQAQFAEHLDIGDETVLRDLLRRVGVHSEHALQASQAPEIKTQLQKNTEAAQKCGLFGAPSFTVREELFWGDDRLPDALEWSKTMA